MRSFVLAAVAAAGFAAPALAQDAAPFTGPRAEGVVGWDRLSDGSGQDSGSSDGVVYGGAIGYDLQAGGAIIGAEAELTGATTDTRADNVLVAGDRARVDAGRDIYVGGRVGVLVSPTAMLYAKGGYTNARVIANYVSPSVSVEEGANLDGYRLGAGAEVQLSPGMYLKGEYRYSNYSDSDDLDTPFDLDRHQVVGGIGIRF